jgi:Fur family ferric uptake transcriptional regulator
MTIQEMKQALRTGGYKLTPQRLTILEVLRESEEHLSPARVHERARALCPRLGLTTVYRTLELLTELGCARRVHLEEGCNGYALSDYGHKHYLVCRQCNQVVEFDGCDPMISDFIAEVSQNTNFLIEEHLLEFVGLCPVCRELLFTVEEEAR